MNPWLSLVFKRMLGSRIPLALLDRLSAVSQFGAFSQATVSVKAFDRDNVFARLRGYLPCT